VVWCSNSSQKLVASRSVQGKPETSRAIKRSRRGLSRRQIERLLAIGAWVRIHPGVYRDSAAPVSSMQNLWAAMLWAGEGALASHRSAAEVWQLEGIVAPQPEIVVPYCRGLRGRSVTVHRTTVRRKLDERSVDGPSVTSPERTIADLASLLDGEDLEVAIEDARRRRLLTVDSLLTRLDQPSRSTAPGLPQLRSILNGAVGQPPMDSRLEVKVARLLRTSDLPTPFPQFEIVVDGRRYRVDFAWPLLRVVLECDGRGRHANRTAFERDRARWTALAAAGWRVLIATWRDVTLEPEALLTQVRTALAG
jgi:very-short-patch-repair endonuclease